MATNFAQEYEFYYLQSRYYDPEIGRFICADTTDVLIDNDENFLLYNLYAYCYNNPINLTDQLGESPANIIGAIVGGAVGAVLGTLLAKELGLKGAKRAALIAAATIGGAVLGAFLGPYVAKLGSKVISAAKTAGKKVAKAAGKAASKVVTKTYCFVAGTKVSTNTGKVAIEEVRSGDLVFAEDPETGEVALKQVVQTFVSETKEIVSVIINGEEIVTTPGHLFYIIDKGWIGADALTLGDQVLRSNQESATVESVSLEHLCTPIKVYNFEVEDYHTYFVGEQAVLVHNKGCSLQKLSGSYLKKLRLDAHEIKHEYLGPNARVSLYDLVKDKNTGIIYIVDKAGKIIAETHYRAK